MESRAVGSLLAGDGGSGRSRYTARAVFRDAVRPSGDAGAGTEPDSHRLGLESGSVASGGARHRWACHDAVDGPVGAAGARLASERQWTHRGAKRTVHAGSALSPP